MAQATRAGPSFFQEVRHHQLLALTDLHLESDFRKCAWAAVCVHLVSGFRSHRTLAFLYVNIVYRPPGCAINPPTSHFSNQPVRQLVISQSKNHPTLLSPLPCFLLLFLPWPRTHTSTERAAHANVDHGPPRSAADVTVSPAINE